MSPRVLRRHLQLTNKTTNRVLFLHSRRAWFKNLLCQLAP